MRLSLSFEIWSTFPPPHPRACCWTETKAFSSTGNWNLCSHTMYKFCKIFCGCFVHKHGCLVNQFIFLFQVCFLRATKTVLTYIVRKTVLFPLPISLHSSLGEGKTWTQGPRTGSNVGVHGSWVHVSYGPGPWTQSEITFWQWPLTKFLLGHLWTGQINCQLISIKTKILPHIC